jgi:phosphatidylserine/phosphatidylglycerophosphate/cardiolipin synthase-like enzyme
MRRLIFLTLLVYNLQAQILKDLPYEKYVDSVQIVFAWQTLSLSDSRVKIGKTPMYEIGEFVDTIKTKFHEVRITGLEPATIYYVQIASYGVTRDSVAFISSTSSDSRSTGQIIVYFNKSVDTTLAIWMKAQGNVNLKDKLIQRINQARYSIDVCFYNLSTDTQGRVGREIANALISAKSRGVKVRFIIDSSKIDNAPVKDLINAGIPVLASRYGGGIMHNKFAVFDYRDNSSWADDWVWTGSWNATVQGTYTDFQNVIEIQDRALAGAFTKEFEEMWGGSGDTPNVANAKFGINKTDDTPHVFNIKGKRVEVYFSPSDKIASKITKALSTAEKSIFYALLTFTRSDLAETLKNKANIGVVVKGILDNNTDQGSQYNFLKSFSEVLIDTDRSAQFHHKYCLVDPTHIYSEPILITGSYNWSNSAETSNDENIVIIWDTLVVNLYLQEFVARYKQNGGSDLITFVKFKGEQDLDFELSQNYPNPFNMETNLSYSIPFDGFVRLRVFDMLGREVYTAVSDFQRAGRYQLKLKFDSVNLSSGVYFYRLEFTSREGSFVQTKKMVLIK